MTFRAAADESHKQLGWPNTTYGVSKVGVSALTRIQQRQFDQDSSREDIIINHVHPGIVDTDMTSHKVSSQVINPFPEYYCYRQDLYVCLLV